MARIVCLTIISEVNFESLIDALKKSKAFLLDASLAELSIRFVLKKVVKMLLTRVYARLSAVQVPGER